MTWPELYEAAPDPRSRFATDGAAALGRVLDPTQLEAARAAFDALLPEGVPGPYATIVHDAWRRAPALEALVPQVGAIAAAAIGSPLVLFHDHLLLKPPGGADMAWHQDFSYLPLDRHDGTTLWIALDDITEANGCLYYLLGSHLGGERRAAWGIFAEDDPRATLPVIDASDDEPGTPAPTAAGCGIVHHTLLLHRSPTNRSARPRRAWALSFVTPDVRWSPAHAPHPRSLFGERIEGQALEADLPRIR